MRRSVAERVTRGLLPVGIQSDSERSSHGGHATQQAARQPWLRNKALALPWPMPESPDTNGALEVTDGQQPASVALFFVLTFLLAWTLWIAVAAILVGSSSSIGIRALFFLPGTFAPGIVAIWLTARANGRTGTRALLSRLFEWQVGARWYVFAISYMAVLKLTAAVAYRVITGTWPAFGTVPWYLLLSAVVFSTAFQAGEEIGWRGFALPRLSARIGLGRASVLLGVIWALWHLPLFYIPGTDTTGQPLPVYLLSVTALSVAMAWLYAHTRGSLLLVMLMHAAINNTTGVVPSAVAVPDGANPLTASTSLMAWLTMALLWVGAAYFLVRMPTIPLPSAEGAIGSPRTT
jgi:membrane protease YdiL (CAAX protease family)